MWAQAGIKLDVQQMESGVWVQASFAPPAQKAEKKLFATLASWSTGFFDPDLQLRPLYSTANWSRKAPTSLLQRPPSSTPCSTAPARSPTPPSARPSNAQAQKTIEDEAPQVLLLTRKDLVAVRADISGVWMVPGGQVMVATARRG